MASRRRTWNTPAVMNPAGEADWCWCGNRVVARCVDCHAPLCERHRIQDGAPPPDVLHYLDNGGLPWPYHWEEAWEDVAAVDAGWLGPALAEQLFHTGYGTRSELALCRACRSQAGLELITAWMAVVPPADGWDEAMWLLDQGFEASRVLMTVNVGPPKAAVRRFLAYADEAGLGPVERLSLAWHRDHKGRSITDHQSVGWILPRGALATDAKGESAHVFIATDGFTYVFAGDRDPTVGRVVQRQMRRRVEFKRLPDERWRPALLALHTYELLRGGLP